MIKVIRLWPDKRGHKQTTITTKLFNLRAILTRASLSLTRNDSRRQLRPLSPGTSEAPITAYSSRQRRALRDSGAERGCTFVVQPSGAKSPYRIDFRFVCKIHKSNLRERYLSHRH